MVLAIFITQLIVQLRIAVVEMMVILYLLYTRYCRPHWRNMPIIEHVQCTNHVLWYRIRKVTAKLNIIVKVTVITWCSVQHNKSLTRSVLLYASKINACIKKGDFPAWKRILWLVEILLQVTIASKPSRCNKKVMQTKSRGRIFWIRMMGCNWARLFDCVSFRWVVRVILL